MTVKISVRPNGPYLIEGECEVHDPSGKKLDTTGKPKIALCRCGHSSTKPFTARSASRPPREGGAGRYSGWESGLTSVSRTQSSGGSVSGRAPASATTVRPRLGENHSHIPGGGPAS